MSGIQLVQSDDTRYVVVSNGTTQYSVYIPIHTKPGQQLLELAKRNPEEAAKIIFHAYAIAKSGRWNRVATRIWTYQLKDGSIVLLRYNSKHRTVNISFLEGTTRPDRQTQLALRLAYFLRVYLHQRNNNNNNNNNNNPGVEDSTTDTIS